MEQPGGRERLIIATVFLLASAAWALKVSVDRLYEKIESWKRVR